MSYNTTVNANYVPNLNFERVPMKKKANPHTERTTNFLKHNGYQ